MLDENNDQNNDRNSEETNPEQQAPKEDAAPAATGTAVLFQAPDTTQVPPRRPAGAGEDDSDQPARSQQARSQQARSRDADSDDPAGSDGDQRGSDAGDNGDTGADGDSDDTDAGGRRRRRRGGRRRRKSQDDDGGSDQGAAQGAGDSGDTDTDEAPAGNGSARGSGKGKESGKDSDKDSGKDPGKDSGKDSDKDSGSGGGGGGSSSSRRRRRRRRTGEDNAENTDDPRNTVTKVRQGRSAEDEITAVTGSTRLEAKKQRRREGREAGRRRAPIVSEAEFLARRESVERVMVIRQRDELTQIGVLEDEVLVEHYVARESQTSLIGNVYLGRVQNVLPSMEAAFIDIGKGRNAVLYAGEVNWSALGHKEGEPRKIESVLSSGQSVLVQVTKDPVGHKGARLTSQISLAGRFLVYVPDGNTSGISRKLPDTERSRLKSLLKEIVPDSAGVIVRTAAEGASEQELTRDVERLRARWEDIEAKSKGGAPKLLYGEPDLTVKVVRDLFTEDFTKLVIEGDGAWETVQGYVSHVAPDLEDRLERFDRTDGSGDVFATYRIDEQIAKGLDRKVWLPSGGSLVFDRTEAMTVVDVNTGKFTGSGGNLEETVTKNNLEAAEEIVRQLRLRDIGGIIVVDFIDMVLESNRDLVLRRLVECLGRDRTRHQVAEVTSLGLVQMTRKRIGTGLLEAFSEACDHCGGRGLVVHDMPVEPSRKKDEDPGGRRGRRGRRGQKGGGNGGGASPKPGVATPADVAAVAKPENADAPAAEEPDRETSTPDGSAEERPVKERPAKPRPAGKKPAKGGAPEQERAEKPPEKPADEQGEKPADEQSEKRGEEPAEKQAEKQADKDAGPPEATGGVTRSRRRAASRRAGSPASGQQPAGAPSAPARTPSAVESATTEPPRVVTRTRRRSAGRPAGPAADASAGDGGDESPDGGGEIES